MIISFDLVQNSFKRLLLYTNLKIFSVCVLSSMTQIRKVVLNLFCFIFCVIRSLIYQSKIWLVKLTLIFLLLFIQLLLKSCLSFVMKRIAVKWLLNAKSFNSLVVISKLHWREKMLFQIPSLRFQISFIYHCIYVAFIECLDEKNGLTPVYKTEVSPNGSWKSISIDISILCNCDYVNPHYSLLIRIVLLCWKFINSSVQVVMYFVVKSVKQLTNFFSYLNRQSLWQEKRQRGKFMHHSIISSSLMIERCWFEEKASFLQFVQNGLDINFMVAIDFTGSNGNPSMSNSLHYCNPGMYVQGQLNQYE